MTIGAEALFVDANILIYATRPVSPWHIAARDALEHARTIGVELIISPQILREYLAGTTRPMPDGSHVPLADALANATAFRTAFRLLDENGSVAAALIIQLEQVSAIGRQIHDANIVATMRAYGVRRLLTNNPDDFARYAHLITIVPLVPTSAEPSA